MAAVGTKLAVQVVETMKKTILEVEDVVEAGGVALFLLEGTCTQAGLVWRVKTL